VDRVDRAIRKERKLRYNRKIIIGKNCAKYNTNKIRNISAGETL